jgi:hypothetical protein
MARPEYIGGKLMEWVATRGISIRHIQPGKPRQNAYIERYNRTVRHEWLDQHIFDPIKEAQVLATQWLWACSNDRPSLGIGGITPAQKLNAAVLILGPTPVEIGGITVLTAHKGFEVRLVPSGVVRPGHHALHSRTREPQGVGRLRRQNLQAAQSG